MAQQLNPEELAILQLIDENPKECDFTDVFGPVDGSVVMDCDRRFDGWKFGLTRVQCHFALGRNVGNGENLPASFFRILCHFIPSLILVCVYYLEVWVLDREVVQISN